ncbi:MAG TPA: hypothetical protein ENH85_07305 [Candidatus Scalindua sp.]|nr:hypothetical protein [Candidatus Scalindua sp.]
MFYEQCGYWVFIGGGRSKKPVIPAGPVPAPTPQEIDIEAQRKSEDVRRKLRAQAGRRGTIITEGDLGTPDIGKSVLLGGGI